MMCTISQHTCECRRGCSLSAQLHTETLWNTETFLSISNMW